MRASRSCAVLVLLLAVPPACTQDVPEAERLAQKLVVAVRAGDPAKVRALLDQGGNPNGTPSAGVPLVRLYCSPYPEVPQRAADAIRDLLLARGADPNRFDRYEDATALLREVAAGHVDSVRVLLEHGAAPNLADRRGGTALLRVGSSDQTDALIDLLVAHGANARAHDREGRTTLMAAAEAGSAAGVRILAAHGAPVRVHDRQGSTALMRARERYSWLGSGVKLIQVVRALLDAGEDPLAVDRRGRSVVWHLAKYGDAETVQLLLGLGAAANMPDCDGLTPLIGASNGATQALLRAGANPNARSRTGTTALIEAARTRSAGVAEGLLWRGARVSDRDTRGRTALFWACECAQTTYGPGRGAVRVLLDHGARAEDRDRRGDTPLIVALQHWADRGVVTALVDAGADVNARGRAGASALEWCVRTMGPYDVLLSHGARVALAAALLLDREQESLDLLRRGANPNTRSAFGQTALILAAEGAHVAVVEDLIRRRAGVNARDQFGNTALHLAVQFARGRYNVQEPPEGARLAIVRALIEAGADARATNKEGATPLSAAVAHPSIVAGFLESSYKPWEEEARRVLCAAAHDGFVKSVTALLDAGVDIDGGPDGGDTPLMAAANGGRDEVVRLLLDRGADPDLRDNEGLTARDQAPSARYGDAVRAALDAWHAEPPAKRTSVR